MRASRVPRRNRVDPHGATHAASGGMLTGTAAARRCDGTGCGITGARLDRLLTEFRGGDIARRPSRGRDLLPRRCQSPSAGHRPCAFCRREVTVIRDAVTTTVEARSRAGGCARPPVVASAPRRSRLEPKETAGVGARATKCRWHGRLDDDDRDGLLSTIGRAFTFDGWDESDRSSAEHDPV